jgi:putative aldouronate transport system permease protein
MLRIKGRDEIGFQILVNIFLLVILLAVLVPLWRVVMTAVTPLDTYTKSGVPFLLSPLEWTSAAFKQLLGHSTFLRATMNSIIITVLGTSISLILTVPLSFALSTRSLPGRRIITSLILFTFLFHTGLVPIYLLVTRLHLTDNFLAIVLPPAVSVYNTLVMTRFFEAIPEEIKEAARMDGANDLQVLMKIILPLSLPIILTIGMFYGVWYWNEFFTPILYLNDSSLMPLPVLLRNILNSASFNEYVEYNAFSSSSMDSLKSAGVLLTMLPMVLVYPWIQRYFTKGTLSGAVKE